MIDADKLDFIFKQIGTKNNWPEYSEWKSYHYKTLSTKIKDTTGVIISVETIRRLTGNRKGYVYKHLPQEETRNALAKIAGYQDWEQIEIPTGTSNNNTKFVADIPTQNERNPTRIQMPRSFTLALVFTVIGFFYFLFILFTKKTTSSFTGHLEAVQTEGIAPFSNTIRYTVTGINTGDTLYLDYGHFDSQMAHTLEKPDVISTTKGEFKHWFGWPDAYKVRLKTKTGLVLDSIFVLSRNDKWQTFYASPSIDNVQIPTIYENGIMQFNNSNIAPQYAKVKEDIRVEYRYFGIESIDGDNFEFAASVKTNSETFGVLCYDVDVLLKGSLGYHKATYIYPECDVWINMKASERTLLGNKINLKSFGKKFNDYSKITIKNHNKRLEYYYQDTLLYGTTYKASIGALKGITLRFKGGGYVDWLQLSNLDTIPLYRWDF